MIKNIYLCLFGLVLLLPGTTISAEDLPSQLSVKKAVEMAIIQNPHIKEAHRYVDSASEAVNVSQSEFFAKLSLNYAYTSLDKQPIMKTAQGETFTAHSNQHHWDLSLAQPLFTGYALSANLELARLGLKNQEIQKEITTLDLARDVKTACYSFLLTQKMLMVAQSEVSSLKAHQEVASRFYNQELIPKNDLLRSEVALANALQSWEQAKASMEISMARLNTLLDYDLDHRLEITDIDDVPDIEQNPVLLWQFAIENRPVIKALKNGLNQTIQSERLAKSSRYPNISLFGRYEQNGDTLSAGNNDFTNPQNASISLQAKWTFFEWGKTLAQVKKVTHERNALLERIRGTEDQVRFEVKDALLNLGVALKNIQTAKKSLGQAKENFRITNIQYAQQVVTSDIVLDARALLTTADTNYYRALYGYMSAIAYLDRALGKL